MSAVTSAPRVILTSHSIDNVFDYCPRKFEFLNLHEKRPPRESGYAAMIGDCLHDGMQRWLIERAEGKDEAECTDSAFLAMMRRFPWELELEQATSVRSFGNTCLLLYEMIRSSDWDEWDLMYVEGRGWAVEVPFVLYHKSIGEFDIKSRPGEVGILATQGKIDLILRHRRTGRIKTVDIKTTITPAGLIEAEYTWSGQQIGYSHVVHAMLGIAPDNFDVEYCVCRFTASDMPVVQWVSLEKDVDVVDDYWMGKLDRLWRMKSYAENDWFPRTNGGCHSWGKVCGFFDVCPSRDASLVRRWFDTLEGEVIKGYDYWVELEV